MKNYSFIYSEIWDNKFPFKELEQVGWFDAPEFKSISNVNFTKTFDCVINITPGTNIGYFPGSFTIFHDGHAAIINKFFDDNPGAVVVIAPANSDYLVTKYGKENPYIQNKARYDNLYQGIEDRFEGSRLSRIMIDLNPMLNNTSDHNFTDLLADFLNRQFCSLHFMDTPPSILCGKDREYFKNLEEHTKLLKVFYVDSVDGLSSRNMMTVKKVQKKKLILRINKEEELNLFREYFVNEYISIQPSYIEEEKKMVQNSKKYYPHQYKNSITVCKDYADILPYHKLSRHFINPFEHDGFTTEYDFKNEIVFDSDIFSGSTRDYLESKGCCLFAVHNLIDSSFTELLDITDFYDVKWNYPHVDISSRCSMSPFTKDDHINFANFKKALNALS